ncbi:MAG: hypothetical protein A2623_00030 [Caulobacterales bacterium RIFCSPHIGHO2_01_FULL_70_19]|nr:MAG: hypothetical protein A2623_00030 [Caulobacterales bacterium RIFCSPHIGHO2_01_FULL_70_19]
MHAYGMSLFDGVGGPRDRSEALTWMLRAAERGLVDSQYNVARLLETGDEGIGPNPTQALKWYMVAARAGDDDARAAAERLQTALPAGERERAQAEAARFAVEPLA